MKAVIVVVGMVLGVAYGAGDQGPENAGKNPLRSDQESVAVLKSVQDKAVRPLQTGKSQPKLDKFDQPPATVQVRPPAIAVEIILLDLAKNAGVDAKKFNGPIGDVASYLKSLQKQGAIAAERRFRLTTVVDQAARLVTSQTKAYVSGVTRSKGMVDPFGGNGKAAGDKTPAQVMRSIAYRDISTDIQLVATAGPNPPFLAIRLEIHDTQAVQPEPGIPIGQDEQGKAILATEWITANYTATIVAETGHALLTNAIELNANAGGSRTLVIVQFSNVTDSSKGKNESVNGH